MEIEPLVRSQSDNRNHTNSHICRKRDVKIYSLYHSIQRKTRSRFVAWCRFSCAFTHTHTHHGAMQACVCVMYFHWLRIHKTYERSEKHRTHHFMFSASLSLSGYKFYNRCVLRSPPKTRHQISHWTCSFFFLNLFSCFSRCKCSFVILIRARKMHTHTLPA